MNTAQTTRRPRRTAQEMATARQKQRLRIGRFSLRVMRFYLSLPPEPQYATPQEGAEAVGTSPHHFSSVRRKLADHGLLTRWTHGFGREKRAAYWASPENRAEYDLFLCAAGRRKRPLASSCVAVVPKDYERRALVCASEVADSHGRFCLAEVGRRIGLSRERVRLICNKLAARGHMIRPSWIVVSAKAEGGAA